MKSALKEMPAEPVPVAVPFTLDLAAIIRRELEDAKQKGHDAVTLPFSVLDLLTAR